ncbi:MAG: iron ABC transporter permease [Muribaculaceae bacterium]|nr:iron ABC transporter permease [Muribaculaceae bacterium]
MRPRSYILFITLAAVMVVLFAVDLSVGSTSIPLRHVWNAITRGDCPATTARIVINIRLIKAVVALLAGAALSVSGLQMQTLFRNPLAGPYVLGISSGASLGVALFILGAPFLGLGMSMSNLGIAGAAWAGAALMLIVIGTVGHRIKDIMVILILGMMMSSGVSAVVQILQYLSKDESLKAFVIWTMGSLGDVTQRQLWLLIPAVILGLLLAVLTIKPLNLLLFGEEYAITMGIDIKRSRMLIFASTTLLAGTVTAFCGPIGFIGLAIPHVTRLIFGNSDHRILVPGTMLAGAVILLTCDIVSKLFTLPINAITALLGIPVVIWVVLRNNSL